MSIKKILKSLIAATDLLLPRSCMICGRKLLVEESHLCISCAAGLPLTYFWNQDRNPMADRFNEGIQAALEEDRAGSPERYAYACALFYYNDETGYRNIPHQIKYGGYIPAGVYFGRILGRRIAGCRYLKDIDIVIPVPLHWRRKWERGYNQAAAIGKGVAESLGVEMNESILTRVRHTRSQTKMDIDQKRANVMGAFEVRSEKDAALIKAGHILLVDDIFTTGSTLGACFVALRSVFPPSVRISVATLAFVGGT